MGKKSRDKGVRRERMIVEMHEAVGIRAERVPLSGAMKFRNTESTDVDIYVAGKDMPPWVTEVKARADASGWTMIKKWLDDADALFLIEDHEKPLVVLPWGRWLDILRGMEP